MNPENRVAIEENVLVDTIDGRELRYDIYTPPGAPRNAPGVLLIHGGGWAQGEPAQLRGYGIFLGRMGYVCVSAAYRLSGEAKWPAQIHDTKAALRWMRANADRLGLDPDRIAVHGNSAGAHLALMMAATANMPEFEGTGVHQGVDTSVRACVAIYPPVEIGPMPLQGMLLGLMGSRATAKDCAEASPLSYARKDFPPTMLIHGTADELVPWQASRKMYDALAKEDAPSNSTCSKGCRTPSMRIRPTRRAYRASSTSSCAATWRRRKPPSPRDREVCCPFLRTFYSLLATLGPRTTFDLVRVPVAIATVTELRALYCAGGTMSWIHRKVFAVALSSLVVAGIFGATLGLAVAKHTSQVGGVCSNGQPGCNIHYVGAIRAGGVGPNKFTECLPDNDWESIYIWDGATQSWLHFFNTTKYPSFLNNVNAGGISTIPGFSGVVLIMRSGAPLQTVTLLDQNSEAC